MFGKLRHGSAKYDERQIAVQGRAFRWSYFTLMAALMACGFLSEVWDWAQPFVVCLLCICVSLAVFACICIFGDAYYWTSLEHKGQYAFFILLGLVNTVLGILAIFEGRMVEDGMLQEPSVNLAVGLVFIVISVSAYIRRRQRRREEDE